MYGNLENYLAMEGEYGMPLTLIFIIPRYGFNYWVSKWSFASLFILNPLTEKEIISYDFHLAGKNSVLFTNLCSNFIFYPQWALNNENLERLMLWCLGQQKGCERHWQWPVIGFWDQKEKSWGNIRDWFCKKVHSFGAQPFVTFLPIFGCQEGARKDSNPKCDNK